MRLRFIRSRRRTGAIVAAAALALATATVTAPAASAAALSSLDVGTVLTGSRTLASASASVDDGPFHGSASASQKITWSAPAVLSVSWDPNLVRQGRALDPVVSYGHPAAGTMSVTYSVEASGYVETDLGNIGIGFGPATITTTGPCTLKAGGEAYDCVLSSAPITVLNPCPIPDFEVLGAEFSECPGNPRVRVSLVNTVEVTPAAIATARTASTSLGPVGSSKNLSLGEDPVTDAFSVPCGIPAGEPLAYNLGALSTEVGLSVEPKIHFDIDVAAVPTPIPPTHAYVDIYDATIPLGITQESSLEMHGDGASFDLGAVQANNVAPTVSVDPSFAGDEGTPIQFGATATGPCASGGTYKWSFSDGTTAFGANPKKTFTDSGPFTGRVTFTDSTGLSDTADFTVGVVNLAPDVKVLPDTPVVDWGRSLSMTAQALDPGADDQPYLTYAWNFGDATPIVIGGSAETHSWSAPGTYLGTVQVCDDDGGCQTSNFTVTVTKRTTVASYTGDNRGTYSAQTTLSGSLMDEYGQPVPGASLGFAFGGNPAGTASTSGAGVASRTLVVGRDAGLYSVGVQFAGDSRYLADDSSSEAYTVDAMGTTVTYTGTTTGKPNKVAPVSAKVTDLLGRPLADSTVTFVIGSQSTTAVTNAQGIAASGIKLNQKPGTYELSASWPGVFGKYLSSSTTSAFKLNTK